MDERNEDALVMDIDALDDFLMSEQMPEDCMQVCDMDGFLTAMAIGPELIMPSEWLPYIIGQGEPKFKDDQQAQAFFGGVTAWYNRILEGLNQNPEQYSPCLEENRDGDPIFADWAQGFLIGMSLRQDAWDVLGDSKEFGSLLLPIIAHMPDMDTGGWVIGEDAYNDIYQMLKKEPDLLLNVIVGIDRFWKQRR